MDPTHRVFFCLALYAPGFQSKQAFVCSFPEVSPVRTSLAGRDYSRSPRSTVGDLRQFVGSPTDSLLFAISLPFPHTSFFRRLRFPAFPILTSLLSDFPALLAFRCPDVPIYVISPSSPLPNIRALAAEKSTPSPASDAGTHRSRCPALPASAPPSRSCLPA